MRPHVWMCCLMLMAATSVCGQSKLSKHSQALVTSARKLAQEPDSLLHYAQQLEIDGVTDGHALAYAALFRALRHDQLRQLDSSMTWIKRSMEMGDKSGDLQLWADQRSHEAVLLMRLRDPKAADSALVAAMAYMQPRNQGNALVKILLTRMFVAFSRGDLRSSLQTGQEAELLVINDVDLATQAKLYNNLGNTYTHLGDSAQAICYFDLSIEARRRMGEPIPFALALSNLAVLYSRNGDVDAAIRITQEALDTARVYNDSTLMGSCLANLGLYQRRAGQMEDAKASYEEAALLYGQGHDEGNAANAYNGLALIYANQGDDAAAMQLFMRGLFQARKHHNRNVEGFCACNVSLLFSQLGFQKESRAYAQQCYDLLHDSEEFKIKCTMFYELGNYFIEHKNLNKASECFRLARTAAQASQSRPLMAKADVGMAWLALHQGDAETALGSAGELVPVFQSLGDEKALIRSLGIIASAHLAQWRIALAHKANADWLARARKAAIFPDLVEAIEQGSRIAEASGLPKEALELSRQAVHLRDSLAGAERQRSINALQSLFEFREKQAQIQGLRTQLDATRMERERDQIRESRNWWIFMAALLGIFFAAFSVIFLLRRNILRRKAENLRLQLAAAVDRQAFEQRMRELQQQALQSRMNPHFTFNCLNSIQSMILSGEQDNATVYLARFGALVRKAFEFAEQAEITLEAELEFLDLYCRLENLRLGDRVKVEFDIDPEIDPGTECIQPMLLQPILENAFQHGLGKLDKPGALRVTARIDGPCIEWRIRDNGPGPNAPSMQKLGGISTPSAIRQLQARLSLGDGEGKVQRLEIQELKGTDGTVHGTEVLLHLLRKHGLD